MLQYRVYTAQHSTNALPLQLVHLEVLVVKHGSAALDLGIEHVGIVDADQDLNVSLDVHFLEGVDDRPLRRQHATRVVTIFFEAARKATECGNKASREASET